MSDQREDSSHDQQKAAQSGPQREGQGGHPHPEDDPHQNPLTPGQADQEAEGQDVHLAAEDQQHGRAAQEGEGPDVHLAAEDQPQGRAAQKKPPRGWGKQYENKIRDEFDAWKAKLQDEGILLVYTACLRENQHPGSQLYAKLGNTNARMAYKYLNIDLDFYGARDDPPTVEKLKRVKTDFLEARKNLASQQRLAPTATTGAHETLLGLNTDSQESQARTFDEIRKVS